MGWSRITAVLLWVFLLGRVCAAQGWTSAGAHADPENKWSHEERAYDGDTGPYAEDRCNRAGDGAWLELVFSTPVTTNLLRVCSDFGYGIVDSVRVEAWYQGGTAYTLVYEGAVANAAWSELSIPQGVVQKIRWRYHYLTDGYIFWLYELQAYAQEAAPTDPSPRTDAATSVSETTAVLHGTLVDDGGNAGVEVRFEYGPAAGGPYTASTSWRSGIGTGEGLHEPVSGLGAGVACYFHLQARADVGAAVVSGQERSFTTACVPADGSVEWVSPTGMLDPDGKWDDEERARDDAPETAARYWTKRLRRDNMQASLHGGNVF